MLNSASCTKKQFGSAHKTRTHIHTRELRGETSKVSNYYFFFLLSSCNLTATMIMTMTMINTTTVTMDPITHISFREHFCKIIKQ